MVGRRRVMRLLRVVSAVALLVAAAGQRAATQGVPGDGGCEGVPGSLAASPEGHLTAEGLIGNLKQFRPSLCIEWQALHFLRAIPGPMLSIALKNDL